MNEQMIPTREIHDNPFQHREQYQDIEALGRAIAEFGLQQAPRGRQNGKGYQLKFGHRRKRAFEWLEKNWKKEGLPERYEGYKVMPIEIEELTDREMFDAMVIENIHRDDLKPTEVAQLLKDYQAQFPDATSKDIGLVFGMNESTVRGMVRLLDLPKAAQEKLDDGTISQGTARSLLSMQKVAPEEVINKTLDEIVKKDGKALPEDVIEDTLQYKLKNVVEMWNGGHGEGKPRSDRHGWPLDMKNFPNDLLPTLDTAGLDEGQIAHLTNPPACNACPFYSKIGGNHYCGVKECHGRKTIAWQTYLLEQASKQLGIAIYEEADGRFFVLRGYETAEKQLFNKKHKGLRLIAKHKIDRYTSQWGFEGVNDDVMLVVATGEALNKLNTGAKAKGSKMTEKEKAERRAMKIYRQRRKELMWECTGLGQAMFEGVPEKLIERLRRWHYVGVDDSIPEECKRGNEKGEYPRRALVWALIHDDSSHYHRKTMAAIVKGFQERTGVKPSKAILKLAQEWDAEIDAAAKVVSAETKSSPSGKGARK